ncbi:MAG TPA: four helix bundle protein [Planctomycetota bacterium]|nr:four helix bundle protein [Planctomycetota bacterium]
MASTQGHKDLKVFQRAYDRAMKIFHSSKDFPKEERYSLTDQLRRSSRGVCTNIAEAYRKRHYPKMFVSKLSDSDAEVAETQVWLDFAHDCGYISSQFHRESHLDYSQVGAMLGSMMLNPECFTPTAPGKQE